MTIVSKKIASVTIVPWENSLQTEHPFSHLMVKIFLILKYLYLKA